MLVGLNVEFYVVASPMELHMQTKYTYSCVHRGMAKRNCEYYDRLELTLSYKVNKFKLPIFTRAGAFGRRMMCAV